MCLNGPCAITEDKFMCVREAFKHFPGYDTIYPHLPHSLGKR